MVYGDGPATVCAVPPMAQNVEMAWESDRIRYMFEGFASFSRQIAFDKRGTGMSDRSLDIPGLDERVDELKAVMDDAGVDRAFVHGLSEGGPMAIMFAATYPERVDGLILEGTGASLMPDEPPDESRLAARRAFIECWGTDDSISLAVFAPTLAADPEFSAWWPRYERNAANRDALEPLFELMGEMDATPVLDRIECPVLILHRVGDRVVPIEYARETERRLREAGADVHMVELEGDDHYSFAGDVDAIIREIERFTTGAVSERPARRTGRVEIVTLGAFDVFVDGEPVPTSEWGSKRARTLLKRLVAARGWPVTRDELFELLWPDDPSDRLGSRLSVQLSAVRRVLRGGVIADRSTVRLDLDAVAIDLDAWGALEDVEAIVDRYPGDFLPEDRYEDWTNVVREELRTRFVAAARRVADGADAARAETVLRRLIESDRYDEDAHYRLIRLLRGGGRVGDARIAYDAYAAAMADLDVPARAFDDLVG